jgi:hypothetical protein
MKKILYVIADYKDNRQNIFDTNYSIKNKQYADKWGYEYKVFKNLPPFRGNPTWFMFTVLRDLMSNSLQDGDVVLKLDADMCITNMSEDYYTGKSFVYSIDNGNSHCMGSFSMTINPWTRKLVNDILDDRTYDKYKEHPFWQTFREQAAWYFLAGIQQHSWTPFFDLPNNGFHSKIWDSNTYNLENLIANVDVKDSTWNNTLLAEEAESPQERFLQKYNINRTEKKDCKIRHFAGGQTWRIDGIYSI